MFSDKQPRRATMNYRSLRGFFISGKQLTFPNFFRKKINLPTNVPRLREGSSTV